MSDFTFLNPYWFLAFLPIIILMARSKTRERASALFAPHIAQHFHITTAKADKFTPYLTIFIWGIMVIALAGPSFHQVKLPTYTHTGARVLAIQLSDSMYAKDIAPSRLEQARYKALDLLPRWKEGSTGLVAYAGDAYTISPMTSDANTLANQIKKLSPELMPFRGNNTLFAVQEAINLLKGSGHRQGDIVLLTDGISVLEKDAIIKEIDNEDWNISILAIATKAGAPILDAEGKMIKDDEGHSQVSQLDATPLQDLAAKTGGSYVQVTSSQQDIERIALATSHKLAQSQRSQQEIETRANDGYWLLIPVVLLFLLLSRRTWLMLVCLVCYLPNYSHANLLLSSDKNAYNAYKEKDYTKAATLFDDPAWKGIAQYRAGDYKAAVDTLLQASDIKSQYNLGNAYAKLGEYDKAIQAYKDVLHKDPAHKDAKNNLDILERMRNQQQNSQNNQDSQQKKEDQPQQDSDSQQKNNESQSDDKSNNAQQDQGEQKNAEQKPDSEHKKSDNQKSSQSEQDKAQQEQNEKQAKDEMKQALSQSDESKEEDKEPQKAQGAQQQQGQIEESDPVMRKLDQIPDDPTRLIRAQILLQAQERQKQNR